MRGEADRAGERLRRQCAHFSDDRAGAERSDMSAVPLDLGATFQKDHDLGYAGALNCQYVSGFAIPPPRQPRQAIEGRDSQVGKNEVMKRSLLAMQRGRVQFPETKQKLEDIDQQK